MTPLFTRLVVPLDGTSFAEAALAPACALARTFDARITLVRSVEPSGLPRMLPRGARVAALPDVTDAGCEDVDEADAYLHGVVDRLRSAGLRANMVLYLAEPGAAIARTAELRHADLIVMTAHPRWKANLLDDSSTTLQVLARSHASLLAWRCAATEPRTEEAVLADGITAQTLLPRIESPLVVPLDGSQQAEEALPVAERLAATLGTYLVLARAVQSPPPNERAMVEAQYYLAHIRAEVEQQGVGSSVLVRFGSPVGVTDTACREYDASMVVMASHAAAGTGHRFLGSVAAHAIEDLSVPVFVVRSQESTTDLLLAASSASYLALPLNA